MVESANHTVIPWFSCAKEITPIGGTQWLGFDKDGKTLHGIHFMSDGLEIELKKMNIFTGYVKSFPIIKQDLPAYPLKQTTSGVTSISPDGRVISFMKQDIENNLIFCLISTEHRRMKVYHIVHTVDFREIRPIASRLICNNNGHWFVKFVEHTGDTHLYYLIVLNDECNVATMEYFTKRSVPSEAQSGSIFCTLKCEMFLNDKLIAFDCNKRGFLSGINIFNLADKSWTTRMTSFPLDAAVKYYEYFRTVGKSMDTIVAVTTNSGLMFKYNQFTNAWSDMKLILKTEEMVQKHRDQMLDVVLAAPNILCHVIQGRVSTYQLHIFYCYNVFNVLSLKDVCMMKLCEECRRLNIDIETLMSILPVWLRSVYFFV